MDNRTKYQIILNAIENAKRTISELNTNPENGKMDYDFGGDKELERIYFELNSYSLHITEHMNLKFWWNK